MKTEILKLKNFTWMDYSQPTKEELDELRQIHGISRESLKDCLNPGHLPKLEVSGSYHFMILRLFDDSSKKKDDTLRGLTRKISVYWTDRTFLTVHRLPIDRLKTYRDHLNLTEGQDVAPIELVLRLARHLTLTFNRPLKTAWDVIDGFEQLLFGKEGQPRLIQDIYSLRQKVGQVRRLLLVTREIVARLNPLTTAVSELHQDLRETLDAELFLSDELQDDLTTLMNLQLAIASYKTNEVVRTLTLFSVVFMPLSFIAGVYGMNFKYMPELDWPWGYAISLVLMASVAGGLLYWFLRKGWFRDHKEGLDV